MKEIIGIIGYGNMGSAIGQQLKSKFKILVFDKDKSKTDNLLDIKIAHDAKDFVKRSDILLLAVKPQDLNRLLKEIKNYVEGKLIISIAAGISTRYIQRCLGQIRVIRAMPNLPAKIGKGMICLCRGDFADDNDLDFAKKLFDNLGDTMVIKENLMNAATAISGSGPGFFYHLIQDKQQDQWDEYGRNVFIPKLSEVAQSNAVGFSQQQAQVLTEATVQGSIALLKATGLSPKTLSIQVTSKGGTTEAGLKVLNSIDSLEVSIIAALERAEEFSRE